MTDRSGKRLKDNSIWWTLFYMALGSSWILASDLWLFRSETTPDYRIISIAKGLAYVIITALLLFAMMRQNSASFKKLAKNLLASETRLLRIVDTIEEGLVVIDPGFKIVNVNQRICEMLSLPSDQIIGTDFLGLLTPQCRERFKSKFLAESRSQRGLADVEIVVASRPNSYQAAWNNFDEGDQKSFVVSLSDISHRIQREREIQDENVELEKRVKERTFELEAVNRELTAFSYSVSHDLREPIRAINGLSHILIEDYQEDQKPEAQEIIDRILRNSMRMSSMIDSLLMLSRLTNAQLEAKNTSLTDLANKAFANVVPENRRAAVKFVAQDGLTAVCDANLVLIALQNLISNALKFNQDRPDLVVEFGREEVEGTTCYFIRDNGIGFRPEKQKDIFKPFARLSLDIEGEGIGLATVQRIISRHQGRVWAEGKLNQGCTIRFTLGETLQNNP